MAHFSMKTKFGTFLHEIMFFWKAGPGPNGNEFFTPSGGQASIDQGSQISILANRNSILEALPKTKSRKLMTSVIKRTLAVETLGKREVDRLLDIQIGMFFRSHRVS